MFALCTALMVIDIHHVIRELQITLLSDSDDPIEAKYEAAIAANAKLVSVEPLLYVFLVRSMFATLIPLIRHFADHYRRCDRNLACICLLVNRQTKGDLDSPHVDAPIVHWFVVFCDG